MPKLGMSDIRRPQLIQATMRVIDEVGMQGASVALIGRAANVSPGIINHYFGGKDGLLDATMRQVLRDLSTAMREQSAGVHADDVIGQIKAIVRGNFDPSQVDSPVIKTWLAFWAQAMHHPVLFRLQRVNERRLLSRLRRELKRVVPADRAAFIATGIAALIDGIWLRGALHPEGINVVMAHAIIDDYLQLQLPPKLFDQHRKYASKELPDAAARPVH